MRIILQEIVTGHQTSDAVRQERAWKEFMLLPRLLLHRFCRGGLVCRDQLKARFEAFTRLTNDERRPAQPRSPIPQEILRFQPVRGMTTEHFRPFLDSSRDTHMFFVVGEFLARGQIPDGVAQIIKRGRMTALQKPGGGSVRGIVAGDVIRRLVARTMPQQLGPVVEQAISLFQYAMSTRAGCECIAHALQALC